MNPIATLDPNFIIPTNSLPQDLKFYSAKNNPSLIFGVIPDPDCFRRMPKDIAASVSKAVFDLHVHTAGGRIRFCTNSRRVAISVHLHHITKSSHFAFSGTIGLDLYERIGGKQVYIGAAVPPQDVTDRFETLWNLGSSEMHELTLHLPSYSGVNDLYIGLDEDAELYAAPDYRYPKPVVYYGSSITQGACASRPGNTYINQISLMLDCNHINLGFSGNAKAEDAIAQYISKLDMSVFVYDYDHNAPTMQHLEDTHEKMFRTIRAAQPNLPIVIMSMPKWKPLDRGLREQRFEIIKRTYDHAIAAGDQNVYLIPGNELFGDCAEIASVDNCHPNDLGFYLMAQRLAPVLKEILQKSQQ